MEHAIAAWRASLTDKERRLHDLAAVKLKKVLDAGPADGDQGSYFPEETHAFKAWRKATALSDNRSLK